MGLLSYAARIIVRSSIIGDIKLFIISTDISFSNPMQTKFLQDRRNLSFTRFSLHNVVLTFLMHIIFWEASKANLDEDYYQIKFKVV